jgi:predicted dehydrogenase
MSLGVVVVGTGFGCITHVRALRAAGFEIRALVGKDARKTSGRAKLFDVPVGLTSLDEALGLSGVDAVTVATPPHTHAEITLAAIAAGKHVVCEKPFARDADEASKMLAAAEEAGVVHILGCEFRWDPGQALLARAVKAGWVGEPRLATFLLYVPLLADKSAEVPSWWADVSQGGGWLGAHGSQVIDQIRVTLGEFESVSASLPRVSGRSDMTAEDGFVVHFTMRSGAVGTLQSTSGDLAPPAMITRIAGTRGAAWIEGAGASVKVADLDGTRTLPVPDDLPHDVQAPSLPDGFLHTMYERMISHGMDFGPYTRLAQVLSDRILHKEVPPEPRAATFADGVAQMAVLDAIRRSATERARVEVGDPLAGSRSREPS